MSRRTSIVLAELIAVANEVLPAPGAAPVHAHTVAALAPDINAAIKRGEAGTASAILAFALMHLATERVVLVDMHHLVTIAMHAREMVRDNELHAAIVREGVHA
ncbi:TPA: hypothetical protein ACNHQ5_004371 [Escherichia coli]|jgi:hypothetical protein